MKSICVEQARHLVRRAVFAIAEFYGRLVHHIIILVVLRLDFTNNALLQVIDVGERDVTQRPILVRTIVVLARQEQVLCFLCIHYYVGLIKLYN